MLVPREHGAYGQLLFPLCSALLISRPVASAYLLGAAAVAAFLAHEPLLVILGQRGSRAARDQRHDALRSLGLFGGFLLVTGTLSLTLLTRTALLLLGVPIGLGLLVGVVVAMHEERSTGGEMLVATALSSVSLPVAIAGGVGLVPAVTLFLVFAAIFITATIAVRAMIGRVAKAGGPPPVLAGAVTIAVVIVLFVLASAGLLAPVAPYAALPVCAVALWLTAWPPSPRYLRPVGWTLVGVTALTALILVFALF